MKKFITGIMLAIPLAMTVLPEPASAQYRTPVQVVQRRVVNRRPIQVIQRRRVFNRRPVQVIQRRRVWVAPYWTQQRGRRVRVPGRYEWRN
ncbi:hypothetical protein [Trichormus variabilis]|uniref:Uncharacterized protein n=1 Tax=Trichormus variabilis SAG 1403-4b TaxID=447716 RepID=A0A433UH70_ANAVA|nr:hypothetical protein [Trichormus variabilis]MBD2625892.1 hypothetical protein [Trichormus variabilis FACHB-164]RUS93207.1 hypothetical protein DSM107003_45230 [Trichormus variabilis SAG 1403-4b]